MSTIDSLKNELGRVVRDLEYANQKKAAAQRKLSDVSKLGSSDLDSYTRELENAKNEIERLEKKKDELETNIEHEVAK